MLIIFRALSVLVASTVIVSAAFPTNSSTKGQLSVAKYLTVC